MSSYFGALFGRSGFVAGEGEVGEEVVCDRLTFFDGGDGDSTGGTEGGERFEGRARELGGSCIPSDGSDSDLRRVL